MNIIKDIQTRTDATIANIEAQYAGELLNLEKVMQLRENNGFSDCTTGFANNDTRNKITYYLISKGYKVEEISSDSIKIKW